jgi:hypothetical protein
VVKTADRGNLGFTSPTTTRSSISTVYPYPHFIHQAGTRSASYGIPTFPNSRTQAHDGGVVSLLSLTPRGQTGRGTVVSGRRRLRHRTSYTPGNLGTSLLSPRPNPGTTKKVWGAMRPLTLIKAAAAPQEPFHTPLTRPGRCVHSTPNNIAHSHLLPPTESPFRVIHASHQSLLAPSIAPSLLLPTFPALPHPYLPFLEQLLCIPIS